MASPCVRIFKKQNKNKNKTKNKTVFFYFKYFTKLQFIFYLRSEIGLIFIFLSQMASRFPNTL